MPKSRTTTVSYSSMVDHKSAKLFMHQTPKKSKGQMQFNSRFVEMQNPAVYNLNPVSI